MLCLFLVLLWFIFLLFCLLVVPYIVRIVKDGIIVIIFIISRDFIIGFILLAGMVLLEGFSRNDIVVVVVLVYFLRSFNFRHVQWVERGIVVWNWFDWITW